MLHLFIPVSKLKKPFANEQHINDMDSMPVFWKNGNFFDEAHSMWKVCQYKKLVNLAHRKSSCNSWRTKLLTTSNCLVWILVRRCCWATRVFLQMRPWTSMRATINLLQQRLPKRIILNIYLSINHQDYVN